MRKLRQTSGSALPPALVEVPTCSTLLLRRSGPPFRLHLGPDRLLDIESDFDKASLGRLLEERQEEARLLPGMVRTDEIVFNVTHPGKNYLLAAQDRDVIAILPNGRRVCEFHPWEKKLAMVVPQYLFRCVE
jgi:hypothetical protein